MAMMDITDATAADFLEVSNVEIRISYGGLTTTIGRHPEMGPFVITQTLDQMGAEFILATNCDEGLVIQVMDEWGAVSGAVPWSLRLDRLDANGEG